MADTPTNVEEPSKKPKAHKISLEGVFGLNDGDTQKFAALMQDRGWEFYQDDNNGDFLLAQGSDWNRYARSNKKTKKGAIRDLLEQALLNYTLMFNPLEKEALVRDPLARGYDEEAEKKKAAETAKKKQAKAKEGQSLGGSGGGGSDRGISAQNSEEEIAKDPNAPEDPTDGEELTAEDFDPSNQPEAAEAFKELPPSLKEAIKRAYKAGFSIRLTNQALYIAQLTNTLSKDAQKQAKKVHVLLKGMNLKEASLDQINKLVAEIDRLIQLSKIVEKIEPEPELPPEPEPTPEPEAVIVPLEETAEPEIADEDAPSEKAEGEEPMVESPPAEETAPDPTEETVPEPEEETKEELAEESSADGNAEDEIEDPEPTEEQPDKKDQPEAEPSAPPVDDEEEPEEKPEEEKPADPKQTEEPKPSEPEKEEAPEPEPEEPVDEPKPKSKPKSVEPEPEPAAKTAEEAPLPESNSDESDAQSGKEKPIETLDDNLADVTMPVVPPQPEQTPEPQADNADPEVESDREEDLPEPEVDLPPVTQSATPRTTAPSARTNKPVAPHMQPPVAHPPHTQPKALTTAARYPAVDFREAVEEDALSVDLKKELEKAKRAGFEAKIIGSDKTDQQRLVVYKDELDPKTGKPVTREIFTENFKDVSDKNTVSRGIAKLQQALGNEKDKTDEEKEGEHGLFAKGSLADIDPFAKDVNEEEPEEETEKPPEKEGEKEEGKEEEDPSKENSEEDDKKKKKEQQQKLDEELNLN